jgi:hypothetical protein
MSHPSSLIEWDYAPPLDLTVGPGATRAEQILAYSAGLLLPAFSLFAALTGRYEWSWWQYLLAGLIGADIGAGAVANALNSCKRFYHTYRADEPASVRFAKRKLAFTALHIYPLLAGLLFGETNGLYAFGWYGLLLASAWIVTCAPLYLKRPAAVWIVITAVLLNLYVIPGVPGFEWLVPLLFIKIILGHLVQEEPYRPG